MQLRVSIEATELFMLSLYAHENRASSALHGSLSQCVPAICFVFDISMHVPYLSQQVYEYDREWMMY